MAIQFEFIADDFGRDESTNAAMIHSHQQGVLSGVAFMPGQQASEQAVQLAKANPQLQIGWHFHIVDSKPLTIDAWPWKSPAQAGFAIGFSGAARKLVRNEVKAQWLAFQQSGLHCAFINAHHHMFIHPYIRKVVVEALRGQFNGWMRWARPCFFDSKQRTYQLLDTLLQKPWIGKMPFRTSDTLWGIDRTFTMRANEVASVMQQLQKRKQEGLHEFMFHPRHIDDAECQCLVELKTLLQ